jgi:hypothetical protein
MTNKVFNMKLGAKERIEDLAIRMKISGEVLIIIHTYESCLTSHDSINRDILARKFSAYSQSNSQRRASKNY